MTEPEDVASAPEVEAKVSAPVVGFDPVTGELPMPGKKPPPVFLSEMGDEVLGKTPAGIRPSVDPKKLAERYGGVPFSGGTGTSGSIAPPEPGQEPIKWYTAAEMVEFASQPINWAVQDLYTDSARIIVAGEQKSGKTFVICSLALSVMAGIDFLGKLSIIKPGPVLIIAGEDDKRETSRRIHRMCRAMGVDMKGLPIHFGDAHGARMNRPFEIEMVKERAKEVKASLIIFDPLARLMDGDENSKECIASVLNPAGLMADELGCSCCFVHHLGKPSSDGGSGRSQANRVRGSSDIASWFTCGIFVSGSMEEGSISLEVIQRTCGSIPHKFPVDVVEDQVESVYGRGSMRLEAKFEDIGKKTLHEASDAEIEKVCDRMYDLIEYAGAEGITQMEIEVRLRIVQRLAKVCLERLLVDRGTVFRGENDEEGIAKIRFFTRRSQIRLVEEKKKPIVEKEVAKPPQGSLF